MDMQWIVLSLAGLASGAMGDSTFPWGSIPVQKLQTTGNQISFDPLAFLAILHNPRASGSAAKLYNPCHVEGKTLYRWPNTMMVGGALPPFKLLVDHLVSPMQSREPALEMYKADRFDLEVKTDLLIPSSTFPVPHGHLWLLDLLAFKTRSARPANDIMIINLDTIHGRRRRILSADGFTSTCVNPSYKQAALLTIMLATTIFLAASFVSSMLYADMWAAALFAVYLIHDITSITVSFRQMISTIDRNNVVQPTTKDAQIHYVLHQRPAGGRVVIKARQDTLYSWQLISYKFNSSRTNNTIHWAWMITGSMSAAASVICMVNMAAVLQLAYLGTLLLSSILEIVATQLVRQIQQQAIEYGEHHLISDNDTLSRALIRSAIEVDDSLSLEDVPWFEYGQLPDMKVYKNLAQILPMVRKNKGGMANGDKIRTALLTDVDDKYEKELAERMTTQFKEVLQTREAIFSQQKYKK